VYRDHQCDGGQTEMAEIIVEQGADYVLALKDNQGQLFEDVQLLFDDLEQIAKYSLAWANSLIKMRLPWGMESFLDISFR